MIYKTRKNVTTIDVNDKQQEYIMYTSKKDRNVVVIVEEIQEKHHSNNCTQSEINTGSVGYVLSKIENVKLIKDGCTSYILNSSTKGKYLFSGDIQ